MKSKRNIFLSKTALTVLGIGLMLYAASRTLDFVQATMPADKQYLGFLFLLATGIGALIWLAVFLNLAEGAKQRGLSFAMGLIDLLGEGVLVYADTMRESSNNGLLQFNQSEMRMFVIASVGMIALNAFAWYLFKLWDPHAERESAARDLVDEVTEAAFKELNTPDSKAAMIAQLSPSLQAAILSEVTQTVNGMVSQHLRNNVIDAQAYPATAQALPAPTEPAQPIGIPFPIARNEQPIPVNSVTGNWGADKMQENMKPQPAPAPRAQPKPEPIKRPQKFCYNCKKYTFMDGKTCEVCHYPYDYRPPETYRYTTLAEMLQWWKETNGWTVQYAIDKMYDDTHGSNQPDEIYAIWYERNNIPATVDIRNWRDLYHQLWAEYERMFPPTEGKPNAGTFQA